MIVWGAAVALNASGNESRRSQHFLGEVTSVTNWQGLASRCYCFDLHCLRAFYYHPVNPKQIQIQITIRSRSEGENRRGLKLSIYMTINSATGICAFVSV